MKRKTLIIAMLTILIVSGAVIGYIINRQQSDRKQVTSYETCVAAGNTVLESYPEVCMTPDNKRFTNTAAQTNVTFEGTIVCLPHKDTEGLQTLECAAGLKTGDNTLYGLENTTANTSLSEAAGSKRKVSISGALTQTDTIYQTKGTIKVSSFTFLN